VSTADAFTHAEWQGFAAAMQTISPLPDHELDLMRSECHRLCLDKGQALLRAGEQAQTVGLVVSGGLREFYVLADGTERTKGFSLPGWFAGSLSDLLVPAPSKVWIEAAQPSVLVSLPWRAYQARVGRDAHWARFAQRMAEALYLIKVQREYELLALDAAARLDATLARWPTLTQVFSQRDIASYVGVTPVHLSRLRGAKAKPPATGSRPSH